MTKRPSVPPSKVPIIGGADKKNIDDAVKSLVQYLDPILNNLGQAIEDTQKRVAVLEEVKKIFPDKVEVTIKHDYNLPDFDPVKIEEKK